MDRFYDIDEAVLGIISSGEGITQEEAEALAAGTGTEVLLHASEKVTSACASHRFDTCSIINAKSGRCPEDCRWCAQSAHYRTSATVYPLKDREEMTRAALTSWSHGIGRFSFVTSGRKLNDEEVDSICLAAREIHAVCSIRLCMSSGFLTQEQLQRLKNAGISRYHCNLEAAPSYFGEVCTTHSQKQKTDTLVAAGNVGMEICSGGIIGMGETERQRIELACTLRSIGVSSVPINILCPIPGTPLADRPLLGDEEILRCVALFRLILPSAYLRFAGGVARLPEDTVMRAYRAGINSAILGDMLTTAGTDIEVNFDRIRRAGYEL